MSWVFFSILAALCWAIVSIVDKYVLSSWIKKPIVAVIIYTFVSLVTSLLIFIFRGFSELSYFNIFLAFVGGVFVVLMAVFYFKAVQIEEISRVVPLFFLSPLFIMLFAAIFLNEALTPLKYLGVVIMVLGAILISLKSFSKISLGKAFWFIMVSVLSISIYSILLKYLLNFSDFWTIYGYSKIGTAFPLIFILYFYFPDLLSTIKQHGKKVVIVVSLSESLSVVAGLLFTIAIAIGYVTLVKALSSIQSLFVFLFTIILTIFYPKILKEEIKKSIIFVKLAAIIIMFIGVLLII